MPPRAAKTDEVWTLNLQFYQPRRSNIKLFLHPSSTASGPPSPPGEGYRIVSFTNQILNIKLFIYYSSTASGPPSRPDWGPRRNRRFRGVRVLGKVTKLFISRIKYTTSYRPFAGGHKALPYNALFTPWNRAAQIFY